MPTLRESVALESPQNPNPRSNNNGRASQSAQTQSKSQYEQSREQRIKENLERMQKLGIVDISLQLKSNFQPNKRSATKAKSFSSLGTTPSKASPILPRGPTRRSSRLQNATPVSYAEVHLAKDEAVGKRKGFVLDVGEQPEVYTEEHEKLLGNTEKSWTLFVDGYGKDGKRIYDPVRGKTCHQCRQKTLGHHTHCSQCEKIRGQFCGDCLYMRYGENVLEANEDPDWICPVCRGICNCSFCRTAKGWPPTGILYKKISQLGYKSVAHYLIQTQRSQTNSVEIPETPDQVSAKRSLHFPDVDASDEETLKEDYNDIGKIKSPAEQKRDDEFKSEKESDMQSSANPDTNNQTSAKRSLSFSDMVQQSENFGSAEVDHKVGDHLGLPKSQFESSIDDLKGEKENNMQLMVMKLGDGSNALVTGSKSKRKLALGIEPKADSVAGRLRQRLNKENDHDDDLPDAKNQIADVVQDAKEILSEKGVLVPDGGCSTALGTSSRLKKKFALTAEPSPDSIAGRLRLRRKSIADEKLAITENILESNTAAESTPILKLKRKRALAAAPNPDSIAGRLRQRRKSITDEN